MSREYADSHAVNARWRAAVDAHKDHAKSEWPREACGLVRRDGSYLAVANVSPTPDAAFEWPEGVFEDEEPLAVLHSHTSTTDARGELVPPQDSPSYEDMVRQADTAIPWGISLVVPDGASDPFWFGDELGRPELYGREFQHGVNDCYSLIRDWHAQVAKIKIPDFPRDPDWWLVEPAPGAPRPDLYMAGFAAAGFVETDRDKTEILPGDVFLCKVRADVTNHGGVYIGDGLIAHHLSHQLSRRDPASAWRSKLDFLVRHKDLPEDWTP